MNGLPCAVVEDRLVVQLPATMSQLAWLGLRDRLDDRCRAAGARVVLDCEACPELPSIAYGAFIALARDLRRSGGGLCLIHVSERIRSVLMRTRLEDLVPVHGTLTEVIRRPPARS